MSTDDFVEAWKTKMSPADETARKLAALSNPRYGYLKTINGIRRLEIPRGYIGVHTMCLCGFSPKQIQPDEAIEHVCPSQHDPDLRTVRDIRRNLQTGLHLRAPTHEERMTLDRLEPAIYARCNKSFTLPENPVFNEGELL